MSLQRIMIKNKESGLISTQDFSNPTATEITDQGSAIDNRYGVNCFSLIRLLKI